MPVAQERPKTTVANQKQQLSQPVDPTILLKQPVSPSPPFSPVSRTKDSSVELAKEFAQQAAEAHERDVQNARTNNESLSQQGEKKAGVLKDSAASALLATKEKTQSLATDVKDRAVSLANSLMEKTGNLVEEDGKQAEHLKENAASVAISAKEKVKDFAEKAQVETYDVVGAAETFILSAKDYVVETAINAAHTASDMLANAKQTAGDVLSPTHQKESEDTTIGAQGLSAAGVADGKENETVTHVKESVGSIAHSAKDYVVETATNAYHTLEHVAEEVMHKASELVSELSLEEKGSEANEKKVDEV